VRAVGPAAFNPRRPADGLRFVTAALLDPGAFTAFLASTAGRDFSGWRFVLR
jgi:hypothetical protein